MHIELKKRPRFLKMLVAQTSGTAAARKLVRYLQGTLTLQMA